MDFSSRTIVRGLSIRRLKYFIAVATTIYAVYYAYTQEMMELKYANVFLGLSIVIYYLGQIEGSLEGDRNTSSVERLRILLYGGLLVASALCVIYVDQNFQRLYYDASFAGYETLDFVVGGVLIFVTTEITTRKYGKALGVFILAVFLYGIFGPYFPGILHHGGVSIRESIRVGAIGFNGVYGFLLRIGSTWVAIFIMLAGLATAYGVMEYVIDIGREIGKLFESGIAHVAVFSSMAVGSITGGGAANTAITGSFTIPMMKEQGIRSDVAGAIEVAASIGGQIMPPIMGIAAFIIAGSLAIPYLAVVQAGLIPAILYYLGVFFAAHLFVIKMDWGTEREPISSIDFSRFKEGVVYVVPFAILIYTLVVLRYSPLSSGFYTFVSMVGAVAVRDAYQHRRDFSYGGKKFVKGTLDGFAKGAEDIAPLIALLSAIGFALMIISRTGFTGKVNVLILQSAGGSLVLILLAAMLLSLLFGLGMPAPAAYVVAASLAAISITELGYPALLAHLFVFYFALFSSATPPIGPAAAVAAQIADAGYLQTGLQSVRISAPGYVIPFIFFFNSELILWDFPATGVTAVVVLLGLICLTIAIIGHNGRSTLSVAPRLILAAIAFGSFFTPRTIQLAIAAVILLYFVFLLSADRIDARISSVRG